MITRKIVVQGLVQGIGFRPFVAEIAEQLHIVGWVRNTNGIVAILATAEEEQIVSFTERLQAEAPMGAIVQKIQVIELPLQMFERFSIVESDTEQNDISRTFPLLPADLPTCKRCEAELHDEKNRRFCHPFISCTSCGPRYSIINEIPYDREHISMSIFDMCPECEKEYTEKGNSRRHAQTIACKKCGPALTYKEKKSETQSFIENRNEEALQSAVRHLKSGGILAVKDIGGYHLAASPFEEKAIKKLRRLKGREEKPFAVMFENVECAREYCDIDEKEEKLMLSPPRPIVLLKKKRDGKRLHPTVCKNSPDIGAMLPCNPVQIMLTEALGPLIMTSANVSGELITTDNEQMEQWLSNETVAILSHDRPIVTPLDDSIVRVVAGKKQTLRRARGIVPEPVPFLYDTEVFAAGGDLKSSFCFTAGKRAYLSQHLGDLAEESCYREYEKQKERMKRLFGFEPDLFACDTHPAYRSVCETKPDKQIYRVQHHKAHVASVIAEHGLRGEVLGFAFDGTGYGEDNTIWGSEVFLWNEKEMKRVAHLTPVTLIGQNEGAKNADTVLYGYIWNLLERIGKEDESLQEHFKNAWGKLSDMRNSLEKSRYELVERAIKCKINCVQSTSMGRLFDAVSAFLDVCHYNSYEGQAPIELENLAATTDVCSPLSIEIKEDKESGVLSMDVSKLFVEMADALLRGNSAAALARGFLYAVSDAIVNITEKMNILQVALSGGTFLNRILLERVTLQLEEKGFRVYRNEEVPPGDGGICLGQAYLAAKNREEK